ncbi:MAG: TolC family protein [Gemmataceae bacterium]
MSESRVDPAPAAASPVASEPVVPATFTEPASPARPAEDNPLARLSELSSDTLVAEVLARNPSLAQMVAAWKAASARYPQVTSLDDPMFGAVVAPASIGSNDVDFGYRVEVSQKFPLFGKRGLRGENALAEASAAGNDVGAMRLEIVEAAKHAFAEYYLVGRALEVNEEGLRLLGDFRANARERYEKVQGANEQDILQADVELGRQRQRQITLERMRRVAVARINTLLHLPPDCALPPPPKELHADGVTPGGAELRALALARRPDLKALADHVRAEEANRGLADREYYPDVEVSGAYDTVMGNGPTRDLAPQIGVRLNVPLRFERRAGAVAEAEAKVAGRRAELARQTDQVSFQVQEAYEQVVESDKVVALFEEKILPAARANVKAAQSSYVGGRVPFLSLLESERNLVDLRDRYYEAVAEAFRRRATLERVTGGSEGGTPGSPDCTSCPRPARP